MSQKITIQMNALFVAASLKEVVMKRSPMEFGSVVMNHINALYAAQHADGSTPKK